MTLEFDTHGNDKQKEVCRLWLDDGVSDLVYGGSKGSGKSYLGCKLIFSDAFTYPETFYFIARDSLTNIRKFTIPSIHEVFNDWGITDRYWDYNGQDNFYQLYNKSRVYLLDAKFLPRDPLYARFGSMQMTRGWIEEAGEFTESAKNNLNASIGRWKNDVYNLTPKLLQTCNPAKNYLYAEYYKKHKTGTLEPWKRFVQALPQDNKKLPPGYLENLHRTLSRNEKERLLYGNWEYDDDPSALIEYDSIIDLFKNQHVQPGAESYITADIARYGRDSTIICAWKGWVLVDIQEMGKNAVDEAAVAIRNMANKYHVPMSRIVVDEDGVGGGVVDILKCRGFVNNSSPLPTLSATRLDTRTENYDNLKSQCYYLLADRINQAKMYIAANITTTQKERLIAELEQVKQHNMDKGGKKQVLPKDKVKEILGRSPDYSDALMMRQYFELRPPLGKIRSRQ